MKPTMAIKTTIIFALATFASCSPVISSRTSSSKDPKFVYTNSNGLNFTQINPSLPNITIFGTGKLTPSAHARLGNYILIRYIGGTIAGSDSSSTATTGYASGAVGILTLIDAVPSMLNVSNVAGVQTANVGSEDITSDILISLSKNINKLVCDDPTMAGAVVTHGTDTLEETAFFLDATVNCGKPVVIVGAMRPSTAISADGPFNLLEAVTVAASPKARNRGAMVVMNDRIASAFYVTKTNANTMDTFKAIEMGFLGEMISNTPFFFYPAVQPTGKTSFDITNVTEIPRVDILFSYEDMHNDTLYNAIESGAQGIVVGQPVIFMKAWI